MITITLRNTDLSDLYVTVRDQNQLGAPVILNGARLNEGISRDIEVQEDGGRRGKISWFAERTDQSKSDEKDNVEVSSNNPVDITAFFGQP